MEPSPAPPLSIALKRSRRSPDFKYPIYDLGSAAQVAERIHEKGGGHATNDQMAEWLNYKGVRNGAFISRVSAAKQHGFIEGRGGLSLTPRGDALVSGNPKAARQAKLDAFFAIPLYAAVFKEYEGRTLPPQTGLLAALQNQFGVDAKQAPAVYERLMDSAETAGLFEVAGDRTKMIRPASAPFTAPLEPKPEERQEGDEERQETTATFVSQGKLLDGLWEMLPPSPAWDEAEMETWLDMFKMALRVRYRLPVRRP